MSETLSLSRFVKVILQLLVFIKFYVKHFSKKIELEYSNLNVRQTRDAELRSTQKPNTRVNLRYSNSSSSLILINVCFWRWNPQQMKEEQLLVVSFFNKNYRYFHLILKLTWVWVSRVFKLSLDIRTPVKFAYSNSYILGFYTTIKN